MWSSRDGTAGRWKCWRSCLALPCIGIKYPIITIVTGGTALGIGAAYILAGGASNVVGSYVERKINAGSKISTAADESKNDTYSARDAAADFAVGALLSVPTALTAGAAVPMMDAIKASAGKKALQREITVSYAVTKTIAKEFHQLGRSIGAEFLGNFGSWYAENVGGMIVAQFDG